MSIFEKGLITVCASCALFAIISIPLILRKVPRNPVYGYRTRTTLSDDALWYEANAYFGRRFLAASVFAAAAGVAIYLWGELSPETYLRVSIVLLVAPAVAAALLTGRFIRSLLAGGRSSNRSR